MMESCPSWPKEHDWKSCKRVLTCFKGSNPLLSVSKNDPLVKWLRHRPFTAVTWVQIPYGSYWRISSVGRASALQAEGHRFEPCILHNISVLWCRGLSRLPVTQEIAGSNPARTVVFINFIDGSVAQSVEQWIEAPCVGSSILSRATMEG